MKNNTSPVQDLVHKIETLVYSVNDIEGYEKKLLREILNKQGWEELRDVSISVAECHVIDCIERNGLINTTAISQKLAITKGGISKITAKLIKKNMIEVKRLENNQKETYYELTPLGKKIFQIHDILHKQVTEKFAAIFRVYSSEELNFASKFVGDLISGFTTPLPQDKR
ncbi:hypothetical protein SRRS_48180 [Sporomusa rhizae]|uniref:MarR family transcriptional regulator n=1 Tax=Sporomusa rhizae TaxID=357999 RepID=UPI00352B49B3